MDEDRKATVLREAKEREDQEKERRRLQPVDIPLVADSIRRPVPIKVDAKLEEGSVSDDEEEGEEEEEGQSKPPRRAAGRRLGSRKLRIRPT